jgi:hypothetical protein
MDCFTESRLSEALQLQKKISILNLLEIRAASILTSAIRTVQISPQTHKRPHKLRRLQRTHKVPTGTLVAEAEF